MIIRIVPRLKHLFCRQWFYAGMFVFALFSPSAQAATVAIVLSDNSAPYQEAADAIELALRPQHTVVKVLADRLSISGSALMRASIVVTVGVKATEQIAGQSGSAPMLAVLVTEDWYQNQGRAKLTAGGRSAGVVVLEQPLSRQFSLVRSAFPKAEKVGAVVGRRNARMLESLQSAAEAEGLTLAGAIAESESSLVPTLSQVLKEADLLLAVPDADVLNRNTVQSALMTTYRYRDPVVGYSKALSRAGALVSLYSSPEQIGRQAGELATKALNGGKLPAMQWPKYFSVSVNEHVARSLGVDVPDESTLLSGLGGGND